MLSKPSFGLPRNLSLAMFALLVLAVVAAQYDSAASPAPVMAESAERQTDDRMLVQRLVQFAFGGEQRGMRPAQSGPRSR